MPKCLKILKIIPQEKKIYWVYCDKMLQSHPFWNKNCQPAFSLFFIYAYRLQLLLLKQIICCLSNLLFIGNIFKFIFFLVYYFSSLFTWKQCKNRTKRNKHNSSILNYITKMVNYLLTRITLSIYFTTQGC